MPSLARPSFRRRAGGRYGPKLPPDGVVPPDPTTAEGLLKRLYPDERDRRGRDLAAQMGPPDGHVPVSDDTLVWLFLLRDRTVTAQVMAEHAAQGASEKDLTNLLYPHREATYTLGRPRLEDQVREADRIARLARAYEAEHGVREPTPQLPPAPLPASLSAPTLADGGSVLASGGQAASPTAPAPPVPPAPAPSAAPPLPPQGGPTP